ncbi:serine/threonine protein kinase [Sedimenticola sp.]|uniref:serine/threonine protein kinase n=1 Tax=Sedimenticola sp. TaxID=1940285 RepID=UPI002587EE59|nr:serine/threonine protein kinase [Sedimenticola sp.]MCW8903884.1 HDOD domain-containing protein [Sedimenticola sp.]
MPQIGRFDVKEKLGAGSQGSVYRCVDSELHRPVAIKLFDRVMPGANSSVDALLSEARTISQIQHPNIVSIFDVGKERARPFLVFEFVDGELLSDRLRRGTLSLHEALEIITGILSGIDQVHRKGIVHRDLKPANIILNGDGTPKVMDFGIARLLSGAVNRDMQLTGTPRYMAPEYIDQGKVSPQADVFALGAILFELLTGKMAFEARDQQTLLKNIRANGVENPSCFNTEVSEQLDAIVQKALEKEPGSRFADAGEMLSAIVEYRKSRDEITGQAAKGTVDFLLRRMQHKSDFPVLSESIRTLNRLTESDDKGMDHLARIIIRDFALASKILKVVNSAYYSRFAGRIGTISRAIVVLGIQTIRSIAASLIFFEHLHNKTQAIKLKNEIAAAIFSATLARQAAEDAEMEHVEEGFLCGMLHTLGQILVTYYLNDESEEIRRLVKTESVSQEKAERRVLGMTFQEMGIAIAEQWNFPATITRGMVKVDPAAPGDLKDTDVKLRLIANFSNEATRIIGESDDGGEQQLKQLLKRFRRGLAISERRFEGMLDEARKEFIELSGSLSAKAANDPFMRRLSRPAHPDTSHVTRGKGRKEDMTTTLALEPGKSSYTEEPVTEITPDDPAINAEIVLTEGLQEVTDMLLDDNSNIIQVFNVVLETIYRALAFHRVVLCLQDQSKQEIKAKLGFGNDIDNFITGFHFSRQYSADVFHAALKNGVDLAISNTSDPRIKDNLPEWYRKLSNAGSFLVFPLVIKQRPLGLIYADHPQADGIVLTAKQLNLVKTLRNQLILAFRSRM